MVIRGRRVVVWRERSTEKYGERVIKTNDAADMTPPGGGGGI